MMKVLVAVDCSEFSAAALQAVIGQFRADKVEFHLLHVIDPMNCVPPPGGAVHDSKCIDSLREASLQQAHDLVTRGTQLLQGSGYRVTTTVREGEPRTTIVDFAKDIKADVIIVGSHGRRGLPSSPLGSVSEYVAGHASCSVEIVRRLSRAA